MKFNEEQQALLESYLKSFSTPQEVADALGYDSIADLDTDVIETYNKPILALTKVMYGRGLAEMRENMVILAREKPTALALLYKDLETRGLIGSEDEDNESDDIKIEIIDSGEEDEA